MIRMHFFHISAAILFGILSPAICQEINYNDHIKPVLDSHCVSCHQSGAIGPMPLTNYEEVSSYASMIEFVTSSNYMPPWKADTDYSHFQQENVLTKEEKDIIKTWISQGISEGEIRETPKTIEENTLLSFEHPDLVFSMSESFEQYGIYYDQLQVFVIPTLLEEDVYVEAIEFIPGNKDIVRSCTVSVDQSPKSDSLDRWDPRYGYYHFGGMGFIPEEYVWYHWSPGQGATFFRENYVKKIATGSRLLFHIHYGPTGHVQRDSSYLKIKLAKENLLKSRTIVSRPLIETDDLSNPPFIIEADEKKRFHAKTTLDRDIELHSIMPHGQLICTSWEIYAMLPDASSPVKLLKIPEWDFHWKRNYTFKEPVFLPKGSTIHALASYDNGIDNPVNPAFPPTTIKWGFGMFEELFLVHGEMVEME